MQRRHIAVAAAVVTAIGGAVAFTLPSLADTTPSASSGSTAAGSGVSPQILAAMQRDLGLSASQATARLKRGRWASGVSSTLSAQTGADFGGSWLAADGTTLKVAVTTKSAAATVEAAGGVPVMVKRSEQKLDAAKAKLDAATAGSGLTSWYVDVTTNKVVVVAKPSATAKARTFAERAGLASDEVSVVTSSKSPKTLAATDLHGADPYFITVAEGTARCSIGFAVQGGFVTAGHCGAPGDKTFDQKQVAMGSVKASVFPGDNDEGFVQVTNGDAGQPFVNDFKGNLLPVAGSTEAPVGAAVCRSGSTTGEHCGTIEAKNQTVVYPEGAVTGLTRTNVCAEAGDSGGSWLSGDQAQGVTSGGSGDCTVGGETFFQPVNEILAINNLTLLTTGDSGATAAPTTEPTSAVPTEPATTEPTSAAPTQSAGATCDTSSEAVQRSGELRRGTAQAQPGNGAFRANAGRQTACLTAAGNATFDLFLQRLTGNGFRTVAKATGDGDKALSVNARAGTYRYVVADTTGSGSYTLGFTTP
jgi:streptogrisin C